MKAKENCKTKTIHSLFFFSQQNTKCMFCILHSKQCTIVLNSNQSVTLQNYFKYLFYRQSFNIYFSTVVQCSALLKFINLYYYLFSLNYMTFIGQREKSPEPTYKLCKIDYYFYWTLIEVIRRTTSHKFIGLKSKSNRIIFKLLAK